MNVYTTISVYKSSKGSSVGTPMSLAEFMAKGKDYAAEIMAYRTLKASVREYRSELATLDDQISDLKECIANPLVQDDPFLLSKTSDHKVRLELKYAELLNNIKRGEEECDRMKRSLPAATLSGYFSGKRSADALTQHSGFICIDIDDHYATRNAKGEKVVVEQSIDHVPEILASLPWVLYACHSVGGMGYFALIPIEVDASHTHKWYFECLEQEFRQFGLVIDPACSDVTRLRIISYDKHPYRNAHAETYRGIERFVGRAERKRMADEQRRAALAAMHRERLRQDPNDAYRDADSCVSQIEQRALDITDSYDQCVKLGRAFYSLGDSGLYLWQRVCRFRGLMHTQMRTDKQLEDKWRSFSRTGSIDIGFFFNECKKYDIYARKNNNH